MPTFDIDAPDGVRQPESTPAAESAPARAASSYIQRPTADMPAGGARVWISLTDDGKIDFAKTSDKSQAKLRNALKDDDAKLRLNLKSPVEITESDVSRFFSMLGKFEAWAIPIVARLATRGSIDIPPDIAAHAFQYTEEQRKELAEPGARIANKHASKLAYYLKYKDEIEFFGGIAMLKQMQFRLCMQELRKAEEAKQRTVKPNGAAVQPINQAH